MKLDLKSKTGSSEVVEVEYMSHVDPLQSFRLHVKWVSCGVVIEDFKTLLARTARKLGTVNVIQVPTISRYPLCASVMDSSTAMPWCAPLRCCDFLKSGKGELLRRSCATAVGRVLPDDIMLEIETAFVDTLGLVPDLAEPGKVISAGQLLAFTPSEASPLVSIKSVSSESDAASCTQLRLLRPMTASTGWFRQYMHPGSGHFVRLDADGLLWLPALTSGATANKDAFREHTEALRALLV